MKNERFFPFKFSHRQLASGSLASQLCCHHEIVLGVGPIDLETVVIALLKLLLLVAGLVDALAHSLRLGVKVKHGPGRNRDNTSRNPRTVHSTKAVGV